MGAAGQPGEATWLCPTVQLQHRAEGSTHESRYELAGRSSRVKVVGHGSTISVAVRAVNSSLFVYVNGTCHKKPYNICCVSNPQIICRIVKGFLRNRQRVSAELSECIHKGYLQIC